MKAHLFLQKHKADFQQWFLRIILYCLHRKKVLLIFLANDKQMLGIFSPRKARILKKAL